MMNNRMDIYTVSFFGHRELYDMNRIDTHLVLPYTVFDLEYYEKYYDNIIIPESVAGAHPKNAITLKNRWMIEQSDLVVVNVERRTGGAFAAMKYAEKKNKKIINLCGAEE